MNHPNKYSFLQFQENAVKQLTGLSEYIDLTVFKLTKQIFSKEMMNKVPLSQKVYQMMEDLIFAFS